MKNLPFRSFSLLQHRYLPPVPMNQYCGPMIHHLLVAQLRVVVAVAAHRFLENLRVRLVSGLRPICIQVAPSSLSVCKLILR